MVVIDDLQIRELFGMIDRKQPELDGIHKLKDRRVCAHPKRKRERRNREKSAIQAQEPRRMTQISPGAFRPASRVHRPFYIRATAVKVCAFRQEILNALLVLHAPVDRKPCRERPYN